MLASVCLCMRSGLHYGKESVRSSGGADLHNFISSGFVTLGRGHQKGKVVFCPRFLLFFLLRRLNSFCANTTLYTCWMLKVLLTVPLTSPMINYETLDRGKIFPDSISLSSPHEYILQSNTSKHKHSSGDGRHGVEKVTLCMHSQPTCTY